MATDRNPVVLVHGIDDTAKIFGRMAAYLSDRGWKEIHALNLFPNNGDRGLDELALQVKSYIDNHLSVVDRIDLVGFSMGGIVSRYYTQRLGGSQKVDAFITLSSPHQGTWTGYLRQNIGARQMRPNSSFLQAMNASVDELEKVAFSSVWTPYDLMILPANSSELPIGTMIRLPVLSHPQMLTDERSLATVAQILNHE